MSATPFLRGCLAATQWVDSRGDTAPGWNASATNADAGEHGMTLLHGTSATHFARQGKNGRLKRDRGKSNSLWQNGKKIFRGGTGHDGRASWHAVRARAASALSRAAVHFSAASKLCAGTADDSTAATIRNATAARSSPKATSSIARAHSRTATDTRCNFPGRGDEECHVDVC